MWRSKMEGGIKATEWVPCLCLLNAPENTTYFLLSCSQVCPGEFSGQAIDFLALGICRRLRGRVSENELARLSTKPCNATLGLFGPWLVF